MMFKSFISLLVFFFSISENKVLKSPIIIVELLISFFNTDKVCFIYFGALMFDVCVFLIVIACKGIDPLVNTYYPSLSLVKVLT
jgi:hypothetical protein